MFVALFVALAALLAQASASSLGARTAWTSQPDLDPVAAILQRAGDTIAQAEATLLRAVSVSEPRQREVKRLEQQAAARAAEAEAYSAEQAGQWGQKGLGQAASEAEDAATQAMEDAELAKESSSLALDITRQRRSAHNGGYLADEPPRQHAAAAAAQAATGGGSSPVADAAQMRLAADAAERLAGNLTRVADDLMMAAAALRVKERAFLADSDAGVHAAQSADTVQSAEDPRLPPKLVRERMSWFVWVGVGMGGMGVAAVAYYFVGAVWVRRRSYDTIADSFDLTPQSFTGAAYL